MDKKLIFKTRTQTLQAPTLTQLTDSLSVLDLTSDQNLWQNFFGSTILSGSHLSFKYEFSRFVAAKTTLKRFVLKMTDVVSVFVLSPRDSY